MQKLTVEEMAMKLNICPPKFQYSASGFIFPCVLMGHNCAKCRVDNMTRAEIRQRYEEMKGATRDEWKS